MELKQRRHCLFLVPSSQNENQLLEQVGKHVVEFFFFQAGRGVQRLPPSLRPTHTHYQHIPRLFLMANITLVSLRHERRLQRAFSSPYKNTW